MKILTTLVLLSIAVSSFGNDAFPTARRLIYNNLWGTNVTGVPGGPRTGQTVYTNVPAGLTVAQLETVMNNCPSNQVIGLSNGLYNFAAGALKITKNGVVFRGSTNSDGFPTTVISNGNVWIGTSGGGDAWPSDNWANTTSRSISSGLSQGSVSVTLGTAPNSDFVLGSMMLIDQTDDGTYIQDTAGVAYGRRPQRNWNQLVHITNISGSTIGFEPPLAGPFWFTGQTPQACAWDSLIGRTYQYIGFENCVILDTPGLYNTGIGRAYACWFKNIIVQEWGSSGGSAGVHLRQVLNCEVTHGIFRDGPGAANSSYGLNPYGASFCSFENNIFTNLPLAIAAGNIVGCFIGYNVAFGPNVYSPDSWNPEYFFTHGGHNHTDLYEGNWLPSPLIFDDVYNAIGGSHQSIVRNRLAGWLSSGETGDNYAFRIMGTNYTNTVIGNVLGYEGYHTFYAFAGSDPAVYRIDSTSLGTLLTNNYNTVNNGVPAGETMSSDTMRDSYRYDSAPSWWGDLQWPPYPVSSTTTNVLYYTNTPAGFRSYFGHWPNAASQGGGETPGTRRPIKGIRLKGISR